MTLKKARLCRLIVSAVLMVAGVLLFVLGLSSDPMNLPVAIIGAVLVVAGTVANILFVKKLRCPECGMQVPWLPGYDRCPKCGHQYDPDAKL